MVIKIGKLIFPPIRDIFILVLIDYNTLHLAHTERADEADNSESPFVKFWNIAAVKAAMTRMTVVKC